MGGGVRSGPGAARTILLFHTISDMPPKQPRMYVPSLRYTRGLGWRMHSVHCGVEVTETSTNKQHHLSCHNDEQDRLAPARLGREQCRGDKIVRCGCDEVEVLMLGPCSRDGVTRQGVC